ncbi:MAG: MotA/TolQ/ExbB proton channel family protein [Kiritimatiellae bacterium]|nr:MotA/TolQ/ExbB proton channel family protein [Kiritimatiellia bacterium]MDW8457696.1 MotA/TolQ/ExbB proton channel family protein [Verrucomicrobiota bacterium]
MSESLISSLVREAIPIWKSGGWGMFALAADALVLFGIGFHTLVRLLEKGALADPRVAWAKWKHDPARATGPLSRLIREAMSRRNEESVQAFFAELHRAEFASFASDLKVMNVAVAAAPLLGLLGTVTGMLTTFKGLAEGGGGEKTMSVIASGISEALITTETGLVIGLGGMVFQFVLTRQHEKFNKMIAALEDSCLLEWRARSDAVRRAA